MRQNEISDILIELSSFWGSYDRTKSSKRKSKRAIEQNNYQLMAFAAGLMVGGQIDRDQVMKLLKKTTTKD